MLFRILISFFLLNICFAASPQKMKKGKLAMMNGQMIDVYLAISEQEQSEGLSGWKPAQLNKNEGMLFLYPTVGIRSFWMPDTYFNLDIIYMDSEFNVLKIDRDAPMHPGRSGTIPRLQPTIAHHVLEIHAGSELSKVIKKGSQLKWMGSKSVQELLK